MVDLKKMSNIEKEFLKAVSTKDTKALVDYATDSIEYIRELAFELKKLREAVIENCLKEDYTE